MRSIKLVRKKERMKENKRMIEAECARARVCVCGKDEKERKE